MRRFVILPVLLALSACVSATPGSESIVVTGNAEQVRGCRMIEQVFADQMFGGASGRADVLQKLRNQAAARGATHVLTLSVSNEVFQRTATAQGELYRCA